MITVGDTFLMKTPGYSTEHLWIALHQFGTRVILVNVTTYRRGKDTSCVLNEGDHFFITRKSIINYDDMIDSEIADIEVALSANVINNLDPIEDDLLERIKEGATKSPRIKNKYKKYFLS